MVPEKVIQKFKPVELSVTIRKWPVNRKTSYFQSKHIVLRLKSYNQQNSYQKYKYYYLLINIIPMPTKWKLCL